MFITYSFRLKDSSVSFLNKAARSVNFVYNYCNETTFNSVKNYSRFPSKFDLQKLTSGTSKELGINAATIQNICEEYVTRRKQFKKIKMRWRKRSSLGWIPFKSDGVTVVDDVVKYFGNKVRFWKSREIVGKIKCGNFSQDARGRWYVNFTCEIPDDTYPKSPEKEVGIDLGLKTLATTSDGDKYKANKYFRRYERILGLSQKDNKKKRVKNIHAKIANSRKDTNHKVSTEIAKEYNTVVVGDVSSSKLLKTKMSKSVSDVAWYQLKNFLKYKTIRYSGRYFEVSEYLTSQVCSSCGSITSSSPKGLKDLDIRTWVCTNCSTCHDRDINAAVNILNKFRFGHESLVLK